MNAEMISSLAPNMRNALADALKLEANRSLDEIARARMLYAAGLMQGLDNKRPQAWCEYGFPDNIDAQMLYRLYARGGMAHGAVNMLVEKCWVTYPQVVEGEEKDKAKKVTAWEKSLKPVIKAGKLWNAFAEADKRRLAGRFSALILRIADNKEFDQPVTGRGYDLVEARPVWGKSLTVKDRDDVTGIVRMWAYAEDGNGTIKSRDIHADRIFVLGDTSESAIGFLQPVYNNFISLEKVEGGSGESFLKNASRQLGINFSEKTDLTSVASAHGVEMKDLHKVYDEVTKGLNTKVDSSLITQGAEVTPLVVAVADPTPTYTVNLQSVSAGLRIPSKVLVGMQSGERASSEDQKGMDARCQARRRDLSFEVHDLFEQLQRIGVVKPKAEFAVVWDDLTEASKAERLANGKLMAEINDISLGAGQPIYSPNQILEVTGFEPIPGGDSLPDDAPAEDEDVDPAAPPTPPEPEPAAE